jgi:hypothetical protein
MAWYAAPSGGSGGAEEMGSLTMSGNVVKPGAIRAMAAFLVLVLHQGIVLCVLAIPRDGAPRSTPQAQGPVLVVRVLSPAVGSVSPCQFPSFTILIY